TGVGTTWIEKDDRLSRAGDHADEQVPGHIAADGAVDLAADASPGVAGALWDEPVDALHTRRALEEHEEGQEPNRHRRDDEGDDAPRDRDRRAGEAEQA